MRFGEVYVRLLEGMSIRRKGWEPGTYVRFSDIGEKCLVMYRASGNRHCWTPAVEDLYNKEMQALREDWEVIR